MPSRFYDVLEFSQDNLCKGLSYEICLETDLVDWDSVEWKKVKYLYDYLSHKGISSKTIIVENYYVDGDYLDDYSNYYAKCFYPYKRICKRLHFFSE